MVSDIVDVLKAILQRVQSLAGNDEELRRHLHALGECLLKFGTDAPAPAAPAPVEPEARFGVVVPAPESPVPRGVEPAPIAAPPRPVGPTEPLPELTLGRYIPAPAQNFPPMVAGERTFAPPTDADLALVEARAKLKGDTCRWAAERRRRIAAGAVVSIDLAPHDREYISKAKELPGCFLWMCHLNAPEPLDIADYETLGHAFDNLSKAASIVRRIREIGGADEIDLHRSLDLLAESQSAVRAGIAAMNGPVDTDQMAVFLWLRQTAADERYYIRRHMRLDDPAAPPAWADLSQRLTGLDERIEESGRKGRKRLKLLGKIKHKISVITDDSKLSAEEWPSIAEAVDELIKDGMAPSNRELRDMLLPLVDEMPEFDPMPWGFQLVLKAIDQHLATTPPAPVRSNGSVPEVVKQVAPLLRGKTIVLIGGDRRPAAEESLVEAFELNDLYWIETREHQSIGGFESYVARPEVAAVLLAIRWSSHSFGEVKGFCDNYDKPLVRLPGGYNPTQVATQILAQCSDRLRVEATT